MTDIRVGDRIEDLLILELSHDDVGRPVAKCRCLCAISGEVCNQLHTAYLHRLETRKDSQRPKRCTLCAVRVRGQRSNAVRRVKDAEKRQRERERKRAGIPSPESLSEPPKVESKPVCICGKRRYDGRTFNVLSEYCPVPGHGWLVPPVRVLREAQAMTNA